MQNFQDRNECADSSGNSGDGVSAGVEVRLQKCSPKASLVMFTRANCKLKFGSFFSISAKKK